MDRMAGPEFRAPHHIFGIQLSVLRLSLEPISRHLWVPKTVYNKLSAINRSACNFATKWCLGKRIQLQRWQNLCFSCPSCFFSSVLSVLGTQIPHCSCPKTYILYVSLALVQSWHCQSPSCIPLAPPLRSGRFVCGGAGT